MIHEISNHSIFQHNLMTVAKIMRNQSFKIHEKLKRILL